MVTTVIFDVPNEQVAWTIGIAMYIFLSGMSAGSFFLSTLYSVFGIERFKPLAKLGVVNALLVLSIAPLFLILDLAQPTRGYYTMLYQNPTSVMSFGVILLNLFMLNAAAYTYFIFRADLLRELRNVDNQILRSLALSLVRLIHQDGLEVVALKRDARMVRFFGSLGVVLSICLAGYTGFLLAVAAAVHLWHSALTPILFMVSALVSALALMVLVLVIKERYFARGRSIDPRFMRELSRYLGLSLLIDLGLMTSELILLYKSGGHEGRILLDLFFHGSFQFTFVGLELLLGGLLPLLLIFPSRFRDHRGVQALAAGLVLVGIAAMRYNIVIGGQALPKSGNELVEYHMAGWEMVMLILAYSLLTALYLLALRFLPLEATLPNPLALGKEPVEEQKRRRGRGRSPVLSTPREPPSPGARRTAGALATGGPGPSTPSPGTVAETMTRRDFLKASSASLAFVTLGGVGSQNLAGLMSYLEDDLVSTRKRYAMVIDLRRCIGCHSCTQACKQEFDLPDGVWRSWVRKIRMDDGVNTKEFFLPRLCNHCDEPPCVQVCPVQATYRDKDGIVLQRPERCIGCKYCIVACPYTARFIHPKTHVVDKCTFCEHRLKEGRDPACVEACPAGARIFGDLRNPESEVSKLVTTLSMHTLKPELNTKPMVFYHQAQQELMRSGPLE